MEWMIAAPSRCVLASNRGILHNVWHAFMVQPTAVKPKSTLVQPNATIQALSL